MCDWQSSKFDGTAPLDIDVQMVEKMQKMSLGQGLRMLMDAQSSKMLEYVYILVSENILQKESIEGSTNKVKDKHDTVGTEGFS